MKDVESYIGKYDPPVRALLEEMRAFIHENLPGASEVMQYGVPAFVNRHGTSVIYLFGSREHVNFGFLKVADMDVPEGLLEGSGKPSKHVKLYPGKAIDTETLKALTQQCDGLG